MPKQAPGFQKLQYKKRISMVNDIHMRVAKMKGEDKWIEAKFGESIQDHLVIIVNELLSLFEKDFHRPS